MKTETSVRPDGCKYVYAIDDNDQQVLRAYFDKSGICTEIVVYGYDDQGRDTGWIVYDGAGNVVRRTEFEYGHPVHETEIREFDGASNLIRRTEFDVNEAGRPIVARHFDTNNVQRSRAVYSYSHEGEMSTKYYDNAGKEIPRPAA
jgi:outer membrane protein assembly factor BamE (lipoprotein component of BamABCDE complex)